MTGEELITLFAKIYDNEAMEEEIKKTTDKQLHTAMIDLLTYNIELNRKRLHSRMRRRKNDEVDADRILDSYLDRRAQLLRWLEKLTYQSRIESRQIID